MTKRDKYLMHVEISVVLMRGTYCVYNALMTLTNSKKGNLFHITSKHL